MSKENIIDLLKYFDEKYHKGEPEISDLEYDKMKKNAQEQTPEDPYFSTIGAKVKNHKVILPYVLGSLNKVTSETVFDWMIKNGTEYIISDKIDGVSFIVVYEDGGVTFAATRGDGYFGKDITEKAQIFCPQFVPKYMKGKWILRGEATLNCEPKKLNYKNKRNGAAGILNRDDIINAEFIKPFFYEIIDIKKVDINTGTEFDRMCLLDNIFGKDYMPAWQKLDILVNDNNHIILTGLNNIFLKSKDNDYETDGLVITLNNSERENVLFPEKKVAFKINEEAVETEVLDVEWNTTRTRRIVPTVIVKPVDIGGVTVSRATGFNYQYISDNGIKPNTRITIIRSGDVIPYIVDVIDKDVWHSIPLDMNCQSCGQKATRKGVDLICMNRFCGGIVYLQLEYWLRSLGAEGISHKTLEKLGVNDVLSLYKLDEFDIIDIEGFGNKRTDQILSEIRKTLKTNDVDLLTAMGIPGIAKETAKSLIREFGSVLKVLQAPRKKLQEAESIGPILAGNISTYREEMLKLYYNLIEIGLELKNEKIESPISGKLFSITGKLPIKRDQIVSIIESNGGYWKNNVTKKTDFLITDNPQSLSGKAKNANKYGIKVISFDDFEKMLDQ